MKQTTIKREQPQMSCELFLPDAISTIQHKMVVVPTVEAKSTIGNLLPFTQKRNQLSRLITPIHHKECQYFSSLIQPL